MLKKLLLLSLIIITSCVSTLKLTRERTVHHFKQTERMQLSIIETGYAFAPEAFVFAGGSLLKQRRLSYIAVMIKHPQGIILFDTGLGEDIDEQFHAEMNFFGRMVLSYKKELTLKAALSELGVQKNDIYAVIPSHLHWDHAGGIEDIRHVPVLLSQAEYAYVLNLNEIPASFMKSQLDGKNINWQTYDFKTEPYESFEVSYDIFEDGSLVLVPLPGHTNGSVGLFVNLPSGKRYFFIGDLTWLIEGIKLQAEKHILMRKFIGEDRQKVNNLIEKVHQLWKNKPDIKIIPAHDSDSQQEIAHYPNFED